jgi:hypothetical protein
LRNNLSIDTKATVAIGPFSRRGRSRVIVNAADHDFKPAATLIPVLADLHIRSKIDAVVLCLGGLLPA